LRWKWEVGLLINRASRRCGDQISVGEGSLSSANGVKVNSTNGRLYVSQTASATSYTIQWMPPVDATGPMEDSVAGIAASGAHSTNAYTAA